MYTIKRLQNNSFYFDKKNTLKYKPNNNISNLVFYVLAIKFYKSKIILFMFLAI